MIDLRRSLAAGGLDHSGNEQKARTSSNTLSLISWYSATAVGSSGFPPCRSAMTCMPSRFRSVSINHLKLSNPPDQKKRLHEPWTFWHKKRASCQNGTYDTLDEQWDTPRIVWFNKWTEISCPLFYRYQRRMYVQRNVNITTEEEYPTMLPVNSMQASAPRYEVV